MELSDLRVKKGTSTGLLAKDSIAALRDLINSIGYDPFNMTTPQREIIAVRLSRAAQRAEPWTAKYIENMLGGKINASKAMADAILKALAIMDGANPLMVQVHPVQVFAAHVNPGTVIMGRGRFCGNQNCSIEFVPITPNGVYCSPECRKEGTKQKRKAARRAIYMKGLQGKVTQ